MPRHYERLVLVGPFPSLGQEFARVDALDAHIDALQIEYSPWFVDHEQNDLIATAREFGVTIIAYSPLGKGVLTGS